MSRSSTGTTKGYTIRYYIDLFTNTTSRQLTRDGVYSIVSPRLGAFSVRAQVLNQLLGYDTLAINNGTGVYATYGATPRARLIKALKNRKANGYV